MNGPGQVDAALLSEIAEQRHEMDRRMRLPIGRKGRIDPQRIVDQQKRFLESDGRFIGFQRKSYRLYVESFANAEEHNTLLIKMGERVDGVYCTPGACRLLYSTGATGNNSFGINTRIVTPAELGFKEHRISLKDVFARGEKRKDLYLLDPRHAPQSLIMNLDGGGFDLVKDLPLVAAMDTVTDENGFSGVFMVKLADDITKGKYKYWLSPKQIDSLVYKDQPILWGVDLSTE